MKALRVTLLLVLVAGLAPAAGAQGAAGRSTITYTEGSVTLDGAPAAVGDIVPLGSTIATGDQSVCEIQWNGQNIIRLSAATTLVFNPGNMQVGSELKKGAIALVLKKVSALGGGPGFTVRTPGAVAGVRGTTFFINAVDASTTYVCSCNGSVHVEDPYGGSAHDMVSAHHKAYLFTMGAKGVAVTDSTLLYHSDADMDALAKKIGVSIDWTTPDK
jgi:hypothetical protein